MPGSSPSAVSCKLGFPLARTFKKLLRPCSGVSTKYIKVSTRGMGWVFCYTATSAPPSRHSGTCSTFDRAHCSQDKLSFTNFSFLLFFERGRRNLIEVGDERKFPKWRPQNFFLCKFFFNFVCVAAIFSESTEQIFLRVSESQRDWKNKEVLCLRKNRSCSLRFTPSQIRKLSKHLENMI